MSRTPPTMGPPLFFTDTLIHQCVIGDIIHATAPQVASFHRNIALLTWILLNMPRQLLRPGFLERPGGLHAVLGEARRPSPGHVLRPPLPRGCLHIVAGNPSSAPSSSSVQSAAASTVSGFVAAAAAGNTGEFRRHRPLVEPFFCCSRGRRQQQQRRHLPTAVPKVAPAPIASGMGAEPGA